MKKCILGVAIVLLILHQDFWNWDNDTLVFGVMPIGLAYHAGYTIAAALLWLFAVKFAWPHELEVWAESGADVDTVADTDTAVDADGKEGDA